MPKANGNAVLIAIVPIAIVAAAGWAMLKVTNRERVNELVCKHAAQDDQKPLYGRFLGYDTGDVARHWAAMQNEGRALELGFLKLDLIYPIVYGTALIVGLRLASTDLKIPIQLLCLAPVALAVCSDWTENLIQLRELTRFAANTTVTLRKSWVDVASVATTVKNFSFLGSAFLLVILCVRMNARSRPGAQ